MLHFNKLFLVCNIIIHLYLINSWRKSMVIAFSSSNVQCPAVFEERTDIETFNEYCKQMAFSLVRVIPDRYRGEICYSECLKSAACIYYKYDASNMLCIVCLRPVSQFANPKVGSDIVEYNYIYPSVFARIGIEFNVSACDFLDYSCSTRLFGRPEGDLNRTEIENIEHITSLQFCECVMFCGFILTLATNVSYSIGCHGIHRSYMGDRFEFDIDEHLIGLELLYDEYHVLGIRFHTNNDNIIQSDGYDFFRSNNWINHCVIERGDITGIDWTYYLGSIRIQFQSC